MALDSGLSTGGFTDCLLQYGASFVYGVDVGYGQVGFKGEYIERGCFYFIFIHQLELFYFINWGPLLLYKIQGKAFHRIS